MPGSSLSLGPPTKRRRIRCRRQNRSAAGTARSIRGSSTIRGRAAPADRGSTALPPRGRRPARIRTPSARRRFRSVRWTGRRRGVGVSGQQPSSGPASVQRPPGHQPVMGTAQARAASRAPRSAPVCPPETSTIDWQNRGPGRRPVNPATSLGRRRRPAPHGGIDRPLTVRRGRSDAGRDGRGGRRGSGLNASCPGPRVPRRRCPGTGRRRCPRGAGPLRT